MNNFLISSAGGTTFMILLAVVTIVVFALTVWLVSLGVKSDLKIKLKLEPKFIFLILLVAGAAVRMGVAFYMRGLVGFMGAESASRAGYTGIFNMTNHLVTEGFNGFIEKYESIMIYPFAMYILAFFGSVHSLFAPLAINSELTLIFLKLPFIISDMLIAVVVYKIVKKYIGEIAALALGGFVAICPVFMLGAIWPSVYSFFALAVVLMLYFMIERKYIQLTICYVVSLMICFEAIFLLPIVAVYLIYAYVKKISEYKKSNFSGSLWKSEYGLIVKLPVVLLISVVASYLLTLPFALDSVGANPFAILYVYLIKPFNDLGYFTYNGLSLYTIFNKNGVSLSLSFPNYVFSLLFLVAIIVVTLIIYLSKRNRATFAMYLAYLLLTVNIYFVDSSELTLLPCLAALMISFAVLKDKRLLKIAGILALVVFVNAAGVLAKAEYFMPNATFVSEILGESWQALGIVASAIGLITHIYFTIVLLDIVMNNHFKRLETPDNKFTTSIKNMLKIRN